jgi:hypothetical protein
MISSRTVTLDVRLLAGELHEVGRREPFPAEARTFGSATAARHCRSLNRQDDRVLNPLFSSVGSRYLGNGFRHPPQTVGRLLPFDVGRSAALATGT